MQFDPSYFNGEEREGFYITSMMKRVWAVQLEILHQIDIICKRHNIMYFADWGTLLGAVRHQGYIPWDDDLDIGMKRADHVRFLYYAQKELPESYKVLTVHNDSFRHKQLLTRIVNSDIINTEPSFLERNHGCPYAVGIDLFIYDYLPTNKKEEEIQLELLSAVHLLGRRWDSDKYTEDEKKEFVEEIQELCNITFTQDKPLMRQLLILSDRLSAMYWDTDAKEITLFTEFFTKSDFRFPVNYFESVIEVPFENTTIPIPAAYDKILSKEFGDYMTPVRETAGHDYPYYKSQEKKLFKIYEEKGIPIPNHFLDS